jgi:hypothetical protein
MEHPVLRIDDEIERQKTQYRRRPERQRHGIEQPPPAPGRDDCNPHRRGRHQQANGGNIDRKDAEIARPARLAAEHQWPSRRQPFPARHGGKYRGITGDANGNLGIWTHRPLPRIGDLITRLTCGVAALPRPC